MTYSVNCVDGSKIEAKTKESLKTKLEVEREAWQALADWFGEREITEYVYPPSGFTNLNPIQIFDRIIELLDKVENEETIDTKSMLLLPSSTSSLGQYMIALSKRYPYGAASVFLYLLKLKNRGFRFKTDLAIDVIRYKDNLPESEQIDFVEYDSMEAIGNRLYFNFFSFEALKIPHLSTERLEQLQKQAEGQVEIVDARIAEREEEIAAQNKEADGFIKKLKEQLPFHTAVDFWNDRANKVHGPAEKSALCLYRVYLAAFAFLIIVMLAASGQVFKFVYGSMCGESSGLDCSTLFSPPKVLIITVFLLLITIGLWLIRLQQKLFLSERHLRLDAEERAAFVQTYLAMRTEDQIGVENQNIMIASLMRPTQDGIIKDDEGGIDPSVAAMLSKFLGKSS